MNPVVTISGLGHSYGGAEGGAPILDDVALEVREGEVVGLLGRSGSGKSTLLRSIAGLVEPSRGELRFVPDAAGKPRSVAMVFQSFALMPWLTVLQNVELGLEAQHVPADERRRRAIAAIDLIGLDGFENAFPKELSGGMRQRVGLARALVVEPSLLLMDEPFSALDVLTAETLRSDLIELWGEGQLGIASILIVTHNIEEAVLMCDRILVLSSNPGRIAAEFRVDLPQPRDRLDPRFRDLVEQIYARMTQRAAAPALPVDHGLDRPLPEVSVNSLAGLIEEVEAPPFSGRAPLSTLADTLQLEINELFPIIETLQMLHFLDVDDGDAVLTERGAAFAQQGVDQRKANFRRTLEQHVRLASHIRKVLDERRSHQAPARRFRDELEDHMSPDFAATTLRAVIEWGRYAELFAFDDDEDQFSLEDPA
ncbi:ABC transporter ATP-binding protein [Sphingomonas sp. RIT328]|uniref:ABC transporter ATP-binding protein n=1 Tax=Sphingomonas sp. RIT328 TaxID=1470591 RepID=UPI00044840E7|nr:nitrate/sulfonate/bicarbonate ABC transporter ATP-binding protein [Sphingomonas sp. RIT328]EZP53866.1 ABC transporter related precursor [Sphingomonas sp. RIT328]